MRAVIICGGDIGNYERAKACIKPGDMIICADSGYAHAKKMDIRPDVVLGDFDSYKKDDVICDDIKIYPAKKDFTDSEIAADYALKNGADEILLLASTGGRIDHTLANIYLLKTISQRGIFISIFDGESTTYYLNNLNNEFLLKGKKGDLLSLVPFSSVFDITLWGLEYALSNQPLPSTGVSNVFICDEVKIKIGSGEAIVIHTPKMYTC